MKVKILCEFNVESKEKGLTEKIAKDAAGLAAFNYLSFVKISGVTTDIESVTVFVDGFGDCQVSIGEDHEGM